MVGLRGVDSQCPFGVFSRRPFCFGHENFAKFSHKSNYQTFSIGGYSVEAKKNKRSTVGDVNVNVTIKKKHENPCMKIKLMKTCTQIKLMKTLMKMHIK